MFGTPTPAGVESLANFMEMSTNAEDTKSEKTKTV
jgi:hypothetical protein